MKKLFFFILLGVSGMMASCVDKNEEVDADSKPEWLGGSIYEELKNPGGSGLVGTFGNYLKLVDDLGYTETLNRTGSKTVFPANDEAFERFYKSNEWGVTSYEQLSLAQKKLLLYTSMIDNALLVGMLSNNSNGLNDVAKGEVLKHETALSVIDTIQHIYGMAGMPKNNKYWEPYYQTGIDVVSDATIPMMVHFTREQMVSNNITTMGEGSDFEILTGTPYDESEKPVYIFDKKVLRQDVTCLNGYVHQLEDVLVPPGNMAEVIRKNPNTQYFSRILDYFSAPYYDVKTTNAYNAMAEQYGLPLKDRIYQMRYISNWSQKSSNLLDPNNNGLSSVYALAFDPGWNQYHQKSNYTNARDNSLNDIGAIFVPDDKAIEAYFLDGGSGAEFVEQFGSGKANTKANLNENLDSIRSKRPDILTKIVNNVMRASFVGAVPSKFSTLTNDASENLEMKLSKINKKTDGKYDIRIANNGVIYVLNEVLAPAEFGSVMSPASTYSDFSVMDWAIQDREYLGVDFRFYLLAMQANYAFFMADDEAFDAYYINPVKLGSIQPEVLHFFTEEVRGKKQLRCERYAYDKTTNTVGNPLGEIALTDAKGFESVKTQLVDILDYHTVLMKKGEQFVGGVNNYYKTKHGGEIYYDRKAQTVGSGAQIDNGVEPAKIEESWKKTNGESFRVNHIIQAPQNSVNKTLQDVPQFSKFYDACSGFSASELLTWAGISGVANAFGVSEQDRYTIFTSTYGTGANAVQNACLDMNVKMFNTYNYTLYVPNNEAMEKAETEGGLPTWNMVMDLYNKYVELDEDRVPSAEEIADKNKARGYIEDLRDFVRYHFQLVSVYADKDMADVLATGRYQTMHADAVGVADMVEITSAGNGKFTVTDKGGHSHVVDATGGKVANKMARDYWFNGSRLNANSIVTSSFCAVHEIDEPLYLSVNKRFDANQKKVKARINRIKNNKL